MASVRDDIFRIMETFVDLEPESFEWESPWAHGSNQWRDRILSVAAYSLHNWPGDIVEIGCHTGATTKDFASLAKSYNRRVMAIDPWITGTQNCEGWEYEKFLENIEPFEDIVDVLRMKSQDEKAIETIKARELCFALVDGYHDYRECLSDIKAVGHCLGVIAVDDVLWNGAVDVAFKHGAEQLGRDMVRHELCKEGYLTPRYEWTR